MMYFLFAFHYHYLRINYYSCTLSYFRYCKSLPLLFLMYLINNSYSPQWTKISSLDELKTKVGHVIVIILLVKMFERSKTVTITTGVDLLSYSVCIFLSSASLYTLHIYLHKTDKMLPSHTYHA